MDEGPLHPENKRYPRKMNRKRVSSADIHSLWERHYTNMRISRDRIQACRNVRYGKQSFQLPMDFDVPGAENLVITFPQKMTVPLKTINVLGRKQPKLQRDPVGLGPGPQITASNIETWVNAATEKKIRWGELIGKLFDDGECAVIVIPSLADWQKAPDFMDSLSEEEFSKLDEETQGRYRRVNEYDDPQSLDTEDTTESSNYIQVNKDGEPLPQERYLRDTSGRAQDDPYYTENSRRKFKESRKHSRKAFEDEQAHWLKENLPFRISLVSATECCPIFGTDDELIGLIIRRTFNREFLLSRDYVWEDDADLIVPASKNTMDNTVGEVVLYEYWGTDIDGVPYVAYSVNGNATYFRGGDAEDTDLLADAVIDLRKEFGLRKLPVKYCWGLHFETDDYKMRGVPFLWPVLGAISGIEALATSVLVHAYATAFGSWGVAADPQIFNQHPDVFLENGRPRNFSFAPMTTTILPGRPYPLVHPGVGKDVQNLMNMLMEASSSMAPSELAFGGGQASSGHDRSLSRDYLETSMNQVLDGALQAYNFIGETILEICCGITKMTGTNVPVYATVPVPQITGKANRSYERREIVELLPKWVGPIFNLRAFYPQDAGENLAELQQLAQLLLQGLVTFREFREKGFGDQNPAATLIEIFVDQYLRTDAGKAEIAQLAAELMGADADKEKQALIDQQRLTASGTPMAALPPELQALNTGEIPPGVDPELFLTKLNGMMAHNSAAAALRPSGPMGPGGTLGTPGPQSPGGVAPPLPQGGPLIPPQMNPQGAPGPATAGPQGANEQAPSLPGMNLPNKAAQALGGEISGAMEVASKNRDSRK